MRVFTLRSLTRTPFALFTLLVLFVLPAHADAACTTMPLPPGGAMDFLISFPDHKLLVCCERRKNALLWMGLHGGKFHDGFLRTKPAQSQSSSKHGTVRINGQGSNTPVILGTTIILSSKALMLTRGHRSLKKNLVLCPRNHAPFRQMGCREITSRGV
jgi:hypothetical protein